ncbi:alpha/beta fold hydrolase [Halopseudomonas salegens]|uniref:Lysophospholipase, alpha-beta hydrolase superfamily n=1 Tax=Halopseudomonas salegens TaxID=1434072 RepID=A0A1H2ET24_9GAMM|nr:alpha/beta fold hydrolase [Halopseudomonas salegens]SDT98224.1 Lysophospholipase, alpha-beta hydrolase superfamily [Halopseudomonas salegens]
MIDETFDQSGILSVAMRVTTADGETLHVQRFSATAEASGPPLLLMHGLAEDGRVFYPSHGLGLAPFLAAAGYSVYVPDLRGHGHSTPALEPGLVITQNALICNDLPALFELLSASHAGQAWAGLAHGVGGLWLTSALIRQPQWLANSAGLVHFATRRASVAASWRKRLVINWLWQGVVTRFSRIKGYVPAVALGAGTSNESCQLQADALDWLQGGAWRDLTDGFDYADALATLNWPPGLYLTGKADRIMGAVADVKAFARELGRHDAQIVVLEQGSGCSRNYGHNDLLGHQQAAVDHFPLVQEWLRQQYNKVQGVRALHRPDNREEDRPCTTS